jgi:hypothetical protein
MTDIVNKPPHYCQGGVECIEAIEALGIHREYVRANAIKYLWRLNDKGKSLEDARKAQWYINRLVGYLEAEYAATCLTKTGATSSTASQNPLNEQAPAPSLKKPTCEGSCSDGLTGSEPESLPCDVTWPYQVMTSPLDKTAHRCSEVSASLSEAPNG